MFRQNNIQEGTSYRSLQAMGGTEALARQLRTSTEKGIEPSSVEDRTHV